MKKNLITLLIILSALIFVNCGDKKEVKSPDNVVIKLPEGDNKYKLKWKPISDVKGYNIYFGCAEHKVTENEMIKLNTELVTENEFKFELPSSCNYDVVNGVHIMVGVSIVTDDGEGPKSFVNIMRISEILKA